MIDITADINVLVIKYATNAFFWYNKLSLAMPETLSRSASTTPQIAVINARLSKLYRFPYRFAVLHWILSLSPSKRTSKEHFCPIRRQEGPQHLPLIPVFWVGSLDWLQHWSPAACGVASGGQYVHTGLADGTQHLWETCTVSKHQMEPSQDNLQHLKWRCTPTCSRVQPIPLSAVIFFVVA